MLQMTPRINFLRLIVNRFWLECLYLREHDILRHILLKVQHIRVGLAIHALDKGLILILINILLRFV